jgi:ribosome-interacting GTPase 1
MATKIKPRKEIKKIIAEFSRYRKSTDKKIAGLSAKVAKLQKMVEKNMKQEDNTANSS